jgi:hypothetical protein
MLILAQNLLSSSGGLLSAIDLLIRLQVTVEAGEQKVYPKIGEDDRDKARYGKQGGLFPPPLMGVSGM